MPPAHVTGPSAVPARLWLIVELTIVSGPVLVMPPPATGTQVGDAIGPTQVPSCGDATLKLTIDSVRLNGPSLRMPAPPTSTASLGHTPAWHWLGVVFPVTATRVRASVPWFCNPPTPSVMVRSESFRIP